MLAMLASIMWHRSLHLSAPLATARRGPAAVACAPIFISSASNARFKLVKKLHNRRHREKSGLVLLEGLRLVIDALEAGLRPELVIMAEDTLSTSPEGARLRAALRSLPPDNLAYAPEALVAQLSDTQTPQGVIAVLAPPDFPLPRQPDLVLVCDRVSDPGNIGTLLRSAAGAGTSVVLLTPGCCDPWGPKALRAGMGAQLRLPLKATRTWDETAALLDAWGCQLHGADASGKMAHWDIDWCVPSALVVGSEAHGLSEECRADSRIKLCHIPMASELESLNAGVAGSIILYEAQRQRHLFRHRSPAPL